jgi:dienelactone hydrolase
VGTLFDTVEAVVKCICFKLLFIAALVLPGLVYAQAGRIELYPIQTVTLSAQQFLTGDKNGKPTLLGGELRLPAANAAKYPAVVLVHGSGGIRNNVDLWAMELNSLGIAVFILDTFTGRGIVSTSLDQTQLHELAMLYDSYRALELLAKHSRIDASRIAIMGFSKGSVAAAYSSIARFNKMHGAPGATFAAHLGFYTPCNTTFMDETVTTGKPIRLYHGAADDLVQIGPCKAYAERLRAAGLDAQVIEYPGAWHTFESPGPSLVPRKGPNRGACRNEEKPGGQIFNTETGKPFTFDDKCVTHAAHLGYSPDAHAKSIRDVARFLTETFHLKN